jgi:hypothetical protein
VKGDDVRWDYVLDDAFVDEPDMCTLPSSVQNGNWFGATIAGTGTGTVVEIFLSATELVPDPNDWPLPVCTLTQDPATPVDTGDRVGIRSFSAGNTGDSFMDDVCVGDVP